MTPDSLVEAIRSAPCRTRPKHPECVAAAVRTWIEGELLAEQDEWPLSRAAIDSMRRRLCGDPQDLDVEPEG